MEGPLERHYGSYRITFGIAEQLEEEPATHIEVWRDERKVKEYDIDLGEGPTPHVEVWKGRHKVGNYDMASGRPLPGWEAFPRVNEFIRQYLTDKQVQRKLMAAIEGSFFDLHKPAGQYGGIPKGFKVTVSVGIEE